MHVGTKLHSVVSHMYRKHLIRVLEGLVKLLLLQCVRYEMELIKGHSSQELDLENKKEQRVIFCDSFTHLIQTHAGTVINVLHLANR